VIVVFDGPEGAAPPEPPAGVGLLHTTGEEGFARAANRGLAHAASALGAQLVLLLNDDAVLEPGCLAALVAAWRPGVGAVGPVLVGDAGVESAGLALRWWGRVRQQTRVPDAPLEVDALSGACMLVAASERFDIGYAHGFEDLALCLDLARRGLARVLVPAARCRHLGGASLDRQGRQAQRHAVSGHLRLVGGGWRTPVVLGLALAQVAREGGGLHRARGVAEGWSDWRQRRP